MTILEQMGQKAKEAARALAVAGAKKDAALLKMADAIEAHEAEILAANEKDLQAARESGMRKSMLDRLALTSARIAGMAQGVREVAAQEDPIGQVVSGFVRPNGLQIQRVRVPLGVIGIIYEARPNVTADAAALCLKAGNAVILRGGKEAIHSNTAVAEAMRQAVEEAGLPADCIQLVQDTTRASSIEMMGLTDYLDVLIPRGGAGLIRSVVENSHVPVIQTGVGNCHVYVDASADIDMAANIVFNAKTSRPSVCNAMETLLVHQDIAEQALPAIKARLDEKQVELRGCERTRAILGDCVVPAEEEDWRSKWWIPLRTPSRTLRRIRPGTARPSSRTTMRMRARLRSGWMQRRSMSTPPRALPTAANSAAARRSASPPRSCTPAGPWACAS